MATALQILHDSISFIFSHLLIINVLLSIVVVFFQRRNPKSVWAWLLILYFIPVLGFVFYLLIGADMREFDTSFFIIVIQILCLSRLRLIFLSNFMILYVLFCAFCGIIDSIGGFLMYINITGSKDNKDVYITQSYRNENGKTSSRIYKKLVKYNDLLAQFSGSEAAMMEWAKKEAEKETLLYNQRKEKVTVSFSPLARIPLEVERLFNAGYLFLQQLCTELRLDNICRKIRNHHWIPNDIHTNLTDLV